MIKTGLLDYNTAEPINSSPFDVKNVQFNLKVCRLIVMVQWIDIQMVLQAAEVTEPFSISILLHKLKCKCPFLSLAAIKSVDYIIFWEVRRILSFTLQFASKRVSNLCSLCVSVSKYPFKRRQSRMDNGLLRL